MKIAFHAGHCCGIKTIWGFNDSSPSSLLPAKRKTKHNDPDQCGADTSSSTNFYQPAAPAETYLERLDRYLKYLDATRPQGIVEVALADDDCDGDSVTCWNTRHYGVCHCHDGDQTAVWRAILEERGFKEVSNCLNSNSGNRVYVFHRCKE